MPRGGEDYWFTVPDGRLKGRIFASPGTTAHPVLVIVLHGDVPRPPPSYQYDFAQAVAEGSDAVPALPGNVRSMFGKDAPRGDLVAAGLLRPGYVDASGDRSDGAMGDGAADNYTARVVDDVAAATRQLQTRFSPRITILVGHSGGAAIIADLLGRTPDIAADALLVACGCDPVDRRARWKAEKPDPVLDKYNPSLLPLDMAASVSPRTRVRLLVGALDDNALPQYSQRYAQALRAHGVDAAATVLPGLGHNILFTRQTVDALRQLVAVADR